MATIAAARMELVAQARAFQHALLELLPLIHAEDRALASAHAVSATQCLALRLCSEDTPLTVNDLAMLLHLDKSTASRVAAGLVEKGYLSRSRDQADGRVAWLEATPAGHRLRMSLEDAWAARYAEVLSNFDPEVRSAMTRLLSRLTASMAARAERAVDG